MTQIASRPAAAETASSRRCHEGAGRDEGVTSSGDRCLPDDSRTEVRADPLVGDSGQRVACQEADPAVGALGRGPRVDGHDGVGVARDRLASHERRGEAAGEDLQVGFQEPGALAADGVAVLERTVGRRVVLDGDDGLGEHGCRPPRRVALIPRRSGRPHVAATCRACCHGRTPSSPYVLTGSCLHADDAPRGGRS